jgi:hypothetical protein
VWLAAAGYSIWLTHADVWLLWPALLPFVDVIIMWLEAAVIIMVDAS